MTTLYVLREEPGATEHDLLEHASPGDSVLLVQDAVHAADEIDGALEVYSCLYDLGIRDLEPGAAEAADYDDIADLIAQNDRTISL